ncbi:hypothetical protein ZIOFF_043209 [Zingiber officinale]|uniref:Uncharacterized protein n=1 Tax=Zingiber officinale TaxID=94328 RepID=A0A8J5G323_ZINOF|nr:hypothetical protein ZIOFF_043209 [Zingiber officinale]
MGLNGHGFSLQMSDHLAAAQLFAGGSIPLWFWSMMSILRSTVWSLLMVILMIHSAHPLRDIETPTSKTDPHCPPEILPQPS